MNIIKKAIKVIWRNNLYKELKRECIKKQTTEKHKGKPQKSYIKRKYKFEILKYNFDISYINAAILTA